MIQLNLDTVLRAVNGRTVSSRDILGACFTGVSTDSRTIRAGDLFFALSGDNYDAHNFIDAVSRVGAGAVISRAVECPSDEFVLIMVDDTLRALQRLAAYVRQIRHIPVVSITGTNGKTTTKEMTAAVIAKKYSVLKTEGNLNNHIGLPLTLLRLDNEAAAVLEMGASKAGDIAELCEIAAPDYGIVTNIGPGHLEGFGSVEGVRTAKLEIMDYAKTIIVNADDEFLMKGVRNKTLQREIISFGVENKAALTGRFVDGVGPALNTALMLPNGEELQVSIKSGGRHNLYNALAAAAAGFLMGVEGQDIRQALSDFGGVAMRLEFREINGSMIICDFYNANPASVTNAVKELVRLDRGRKIAVLGDMLELGEYSERYHRELGRWMASQPVDVFIAVGSMMRTALDEFIDSRGAPVQGAAVHAADSVEAGRILKQLIANDTVLIKGSRGLKMERVLE
ncbi:UDP-N-acetylmuramoyl-tripeptide--D-alanyl-D-alanine ligase [Candidatus Magnetominusculus xianensis]|uniref:UDP-N-acetylmuramoyl-tripeptide--D-alanyl-D-alanine ligase n=1 Tax=Candidatus Magnetominusculus xianensis TaxID=1748249 RepID=A0ABR5SGG1_9BACT|nr:UDP-N-acetylmuramoyl-tripeptide--D-alanyl-D-alanine ligase [Candidatus Magnetominusculus xianensis]KWT89803.1 UDP-N-acetylmuramoyl-tripeptide--D-alanyl-D-alanine ligase [Candidatus Magnetominusculus xianensis]MBF0404590.1 UDP-N-acetylmuramoyl-tripeptide--D-alanyl-D-alanine ligase [Nitrospirota bacterium]